jgi:hypothetical protein
MAGQPEGALTVQQTFVSFTPDAWRARKHSG